ncbi:Centromere/kinetochore protein zw10 [Apis cerana cerana]|uniref:Centromere/kinetochore protein zw10 n=1 Tax=Apis cerana cerana TaxID=94128 RepID=A0A2A3EPL7_APICC|nr:Centromere/kinetochore protein zw10 [Apis cerana cerana]
MTSFLADVLITAGKLEKVNLHEKISEIQKEITKLKYDVKNFMDDNYVEFTSKLTRDQHLVLKGEKLLEEMNALQKRIDNHVKIELSGSTKELKTLSQALKESNIMLQLSNQLLNLHECIKSIKNYQEEKLYVKVAKTLCHMQTTLYNSQTDLRDLDIYTAIEEEYLNLYTSFLSDTSLLLHERICWIGIDDQNAKAVTLSIKNEFDDIQDLIQSLHYIDNLSNYLHKFSMTLMDYIINPIINDDCSVYVIDEKVFTVEIFKKKKSPGYKSEPLEFLEDIDDYNEIKVNKKINDNTFQLPKCQISKNAKEILDLARNILDEACCSSDTCAIQLFYTCRNFFEMYAGLVPEHHRKFLETIPQQVAMFHNNCMYLAHHLLTLGFEYKDKLPKSLQNLNLTFADQVLVLRDVGSSCFLEHMKYQRNIIFDILKESGLSALGQTSELHPNTERAMRQCNRQLELLKTVWLDVLPENIYCRAVGCIMNSMIEDLIIRVLSVEDIPADVATELVTLFNLIVKRAPQIFPDHQKIYQYVKKWEKFLELIQILGASLKEIEIRWDSGKGPLAQEFTASQVKQLIRALFQNTERRSNLLVNIK